MSGLITSGHFKTALSDLRSLEMTALPLELLSFPGRPTISPCQRASCANGFSVKDVRALVPGQRKASGFLEKKHSSLCLNCHIVGFMEWQEGLVPCERFC